MTNKEKLMQVFGLFEDQVNVFCNHCTNCLSTGKLCDNYDKKHHANRFGCGLWLDSEYVEPDFLKTQQIHYLKHGGDILKIQDYLEQDNIHISLDRIDYEWHRYSMDEYSVDWVKPEYYYLRRFIELRKGETSESKIVAHISKDYCEKFCEGFKAGLEEKL